MTTTQVQPESLRSYFAVLAEQARALHQEEEAMARAGGQEGSLSSAGLEVLACIAFKQPLSLPEINGYFGVDKRTAVHRLQHLGLVDCRRADGTGRTVWITTGEFLRRFQLQSPAELLQRWQTGEDERRQKPGGSTSWLEE